MSICCIVLMARLSVAGQSGLTWALAASSPAAPSRLIRQISFRSFNPAQGVEHQVELVLDLIDPSFDDRGA